jgi:hypothetical protein
MLIGLQLLCTGIFLSSVAVLCVTARPRPYSDLRLWVRYIAWWVIVFDLLALALSVFYVFLPQEFLLLLGIGLGLGLLVGFCAGGWAVQERHIRAQATAPQPSTLPDVGPRWAGRATEKPPTPVAVQPDRKDVSADHAGTDA